MDVHDKLDEITRYVEEARAMPMSASALVNRAEVLTLLDELRDLLPEELHHADLLLSDRDAVVQQGRQEADDLLAAARSEHDRLVEGTEVVRSARQRAGSVQAQAQAEATRLLSEADDYVDRKLADFEITLDKLAQQVQRGRQHLAERVASDRAHALDDTGHHVDSGAGHDHGPHLSRDQGREDHLGGHLGGAAAPHPTEPADEPFDQRRRDPLRDALAEPLPTGGHELGEHGVVR